ncbi:hypothetical protein AB0B27_05660 [Micromonospora rifamycinica]|uniref:hypothetical protein n=1 Tax=Micromonospora rifamycinica TaxID=291594 RepID=UPI0033E90B1B
MTPPLPCPCGDSYCADNTPLTTVDRTDCCPYCGWTDCDVCGWTAPIPTGGDQK